MYTSLQSLSSIWYSLEKKYFCLIRLYRIKYFWQALIVYYSLNFTFYYYFHIKIKASSLNMMQVTIEVSVCVCVCVCVSSFAPLNGHTLNIY